MARIREDAPCVDPRDRPASQLKRPKSTGEPLDPSTAADGAAAPTLAVPNGDAPSGQVDTLMNDATAEVVDPKVKQLAVFTTGGSDDEGSANGTANGRNGDGADSSDDDVPLAQQAKAAHVAGKGPVPGVDNDGGNESSEDEKPLAQQARAQKNGKPASAQNGKKAAPPPAADSSDSEDEKPLAKVAQTKRPRASTSRAKPVKKDDSDDDSLSEQDDDEDDYDSDEPLSAKKKGKGKAKPAAAKKAAAPKKAPVPKKAPARKPKKEETEASASPAPAKKGKGKAKKEDDEEGSVGSEDDDVHKWWEENNDGEEKVRALLCVLENARD